MKELFTWRDVQDQVDGSNEKPWIRASADTTTLRIECLPGQAAECSRVLTDIIPSFEAETNSVRLAGLPSNQRKLIVEIIEDADVAPVVTIERPLWTNRTAELKPPAAPLKSKVCAFYSYKGGVGRTTAVVAMLAEILHQHPTSRVLVIDADFEAPGLTWLLKPPTEDGFSYIDALSLLHDADDWKRDALPLIADCVRLGSATLEIPDGRRDFWFLPAVRSVDQLFKMPIRPEQVVRARGRAWLMADFLFELSQTLKFDVVLVDMRTGITEFSSPLLLDPRVEKILVTSCNAQSVRGTVETLRRVQKAHPSSEKPEVIVSLVPPDSGELFEKISTDIIDVFNDQPPTGGDSVGSQLGIHRSDFAQELLHFESLDDFALKRLSGTQLGKKVAPDLVERLVDISDSVPAREDAGVSAAITPKDVAEAAKKLEFAEQNSEVGLLPIPALRKLLEVPTGRLPIANVIGAKGAGKTFAWGQLVLAKRLLKFSQLVSTTHEVRDAQIFPLLAPTSLSPHLADQVRALEEQVVGSRESRLTRFALKDQVERSDTSCEPFDFWLCAIADRLGLPVPAGNNAREKLRSVFSQVEPILLIVDGLEDALQVTVGTGLTEPQKKILRYLLQDFPSILRESGVDNIGLVVFVRRDLAALAIRQNFGQFEALHRDTTLTWTPADALRLPLWLLARLGWDTKLPSVATASYDELRKALFAFWGEKMGGKREAFTDEWVIATLSDFNLVLQARDMTRLVRYAAENHGIRSFPIPHTALRNAVPSVSQEKIAELGKEVAALESIFSRLQGHAINLKVIPFSPTDVGLSAEEVVFMQQLGLLAPSDEPDKLFMPEIIRHGLGFKLANRGRARVLALYREARQRRQS